MPNYQRILKECFWDYNFSESDIQNIKNLDDKTKNFIFQKIFFNSTQLLEDMHIFDLNEIEKYLKNIKVNNFNKDFIFRRKNMLEFYFFNKPLLIEELKWREK